MKTWTMAPIFVLAFFLTVVSGQGQDTVVRYSPHFGVGAAGGLEILVSVTFLNKTAQNQNLSVGIFNSKGESFTVRAVFTEGTILETDNIASLTLAPEVTVTMTLTPCRNDANPDCGPTPVRTGWLRIETNATNGKPDVEVQVVFRNINAAGEVTASVGVPLSPAGREFFLPIETSDARDVGVAVANVGTEIATVTFRICGRDGAELLTKTVTLEPGKQSPRFVSVGDDSLFPDFQTEDARLKIESDRDISVIALIADFSGEFLISGAAVFQP